MIIIFFISNVLIEKINNNISLLEEIKLENENKLTIIINQLDLFK